MSDGWTPERRQRRTALIGERRVVSTRFGRRDVADRGRNLSTLKRSEQSFLVGVAATTRTDETRTERQFGAEADAKNAGSRFGQRQQTNHDLATNRKFVQLARPGMAGHPSDLTPRTTPARNPRAQRGRSGLIVPQRRPLSIAARAFVDELCKTLSTRQP